MPTVVPALLTNSRPRPRTLMGRSRNEAQAIPAKTSAIAMRRLPLVIMGRTPSGMTRNSSRTSLPSLRASTAVMANTTPEAQAIRCPDVALAHAVGALARRPSSDSRSVA